MNRDLDLCRIENTHKGHGAAYHTDLNKLYWSAEEASILFSLVRGRCTVIHQDNISNDLDTYFLSGTDKFYFSESYDADSRSFEDPPAKAKLMGGKGKVSD